MSPNPPILAATLVLMRGMEAGPPELLMIERSAAMAFAGGALVFPGGRVDPGDYAIAAAWRGIDPEDGAARVAAIRETIEEAGIAVGIHPAPDAEALDAIRAALAAGGAFAALLVAGGFHIDPLALTPFARWRPNMRETRNFDTCFYLAIAPAGAEPLADGGESVHALWTSADEALAGGAAGRHRIVFPTRRNLERLAMFGSIEAAIADAALHPPRAITPFIEQRDGVAWICIPEDAGYPVTAERVADAQRG